MNAFTSSTKQSVCRFLIAILAIGTTSQGFSAQPSRAFYVANNGTDDLACGTPGDPCRSISQAVANAADGDTVRVRPGLYGDLNNDGDFDDPGDERPDPFFACMICIFKDVDIYSTRGAHLTVISLGDERLVTPHDAIELRSDGVIFGARDHGFTVRGGANLGIKISGGRNVRVVGNIVQVAAHGISAVACNGPIYVLENVASRGSNAGDAFAASFASSIGNEICTDPGPLVLRDNVASDNGGTGFSISGSQFVIFRRNVSTRNNVGAVVTGTGALTDSSFIGNRAEGILLIGGGSTLLRNTIVGNEGPGVRVTFPDNPPSLSSTFHRNNIFGNGVNLGFGGPPGLEAANCGVFNESARVNAEQNFWGSPAGPGADPADKAGPNSGCDVLSGVTRVVPFATQRFPSQP
jgi:Right handed beta helix region